MGRPAPLALTNEKEVQMSKRLFATAVIASSFVAGLGFSVPAIADAGNGKVVVLAEGWLDHHWQQRHLPYV